MTTRRADPERELVRRATPYAIPATVLALAGGALAGGWGVGWSAALGVAIVSLNFAANGLVLSWAAGISLTAYSAAATGGFVLRMAVILAVMVGLNHEAFFSPLAFGLAVVPATVLLLIFELKLLADGLGQGLGSAPGPPPPRSPMAP